MSNRHEALFKDGDVVKVKNIVPELNGLMVKVVGHMPMPGGFDFYLCELSSEDKQRLNQAYRVMPFPKGSLQQLPVDEGED